MTSGIKVSRPGTSVNTDDLRDLILHSNYSMFKYHSDTSPTMTVNAGDTVKTISFAHGLSYIPAFISYMKTGTGIMMLPNRRSYYFVGADEHIFSYADATNIYITWRSSIPYNEQIIYASDVWNTYSNDNWYLEIGREGGSGYSGAIRFSGVNISSGDSLSYAKIQLVTNWKWGSEPSYFRWLNYGIDEDNTSSFNDPMGRPRTDATSTQTRTVPVNIGDTVEIDVLSMVNEIKSRGGWSSGNAMGFLMLEQDSNNDAAIVAGTDSYFKFIKSGSLTMNFRVIVFKDKIA
jgi:hypothetical protein